MKTKKDDAFAKGGSAAGQGKAGGDSKQPIVSRHSQTGNQQAQHGGAAQGPGKGGTAGKK